MLPRLLALLLLLGLALPLPARALESEIVSSPRARASLVSEVDAFTPGQPLRVALRLRLAPGWYTYWQNPGDAGAPPEMAFSLPEGVEAGPIAWPTPTRHATGPVMSYGYAGDVVLPVTLTSAATAAGTSAATATGGKLTVNVQANWLVCEEICVPEEGTFTLTLPPGPPVPSAEAPLFAAADAETPVPSPWPASVSPDGVLFVGAPGLDHGRIEQAWFAPMKWGQVEHNAPQRFALADGGFTLALRPGPDFRPDAGLRGVVVITDRDGRSSALSLTAAPGPLVAPAVALPLWQLVLFALAAGAILNLMPCVFPVLAVKAMGLAGLSGGHRSAALRQAAAYGAGVVVTFLALAGVLVALRAAGAAVGWGFQFQAPVFVAAMAWLLFAIGLNMSGVYAIGGGRLAGVGQAAAGRGGMAGSFFTGLLAVLVATPCTAPFMGAAVAGALVAPLAVTLAGFLAMGVGFALPYVLLATIPAVARRLPRPGPWMDVLRQLMAFPMYAASVWLLWVVSLQAGPTGVLFTAAGMLLVAFALWAVHLAQTRAGLLRRVATGLAVVAGLAAVAMLSTLTTSPQAAAGTAPADEAAAGFEPYSSTRLAALRQEGRSVFVNMTAAWCVTCLVNEQVALNRDEVRRAFAASGVVYMKGDWTRRDPVITQYLQGLGRDGVPLYALYPAGGGDPVVLPQILTVQRVLDALGRAGS